MSLLVFTSSRDTLSFLLLLLGHTVAAIALPGVNNETALNLECTNDFIDRMFCQLERPNCSEYNLTLQSNSMDDDEKHCTFQQCDSGQCCCSVELMLIYGETHTATVWKGGRILKLKNISVVKSIKPKAPEIVSVDESNGNFEIMWKRHYEGVFRESLTAEVTYYEKGSTKKVRMWKSFVLQIGYLKPSTTYMVSVRTFTNWSDVFSDRSREWEFKTPSSNSPLLVIIISLSVAAVILTAAIYGCYVRMKAKWWDTVADHPKSNLLIFPSNKQEVLKPVPPIISSIYVDPLLSDDSELWPKMPLTDTSSGSFQQSSGISTGSSCLSYANTEHVDIIACVKEALCRDIPGISIISPSTTSPLADLNKDSSLISSPSSPCGFRADGMSSGSSGFDNKTYSIVMPRQITADSSAVQMQAEIPCDSGYHPSESNTVNCPDQQVPGCLLPWQQDVILPLVASSLVPTDMSYQQCNADSGTFSNAEDSSLCSISSGINTTASCDVLSSAGARNQGSDKAIRAVTNGKNEDASICDKNLCSTCVPAESHSFLAVDDDYQAFSNLVGQPDALISEQRSIEQEEPLTNIPQSFSSTIVPGFMSNGQSGQHLSELQTPFLSLMSAGQSLPAMTDSGYQCV
uniref:Fibronectin type-III domain-containing protein n=1 Tax=Amphiprion percula TaxID=161767 RepID=A0A3P8RY45_AMPPE